MKKLSLLILIFFFQTGFSQSIGGRIIIDYLRKTVHPDGCNSLSVEGLPDDSMWVNLYPDQMITGTFGGYVTGTTGNLLIVETAWNYWAYSYDIRLIYNSSNYTSVVTLPKTLNSWTSSLYGISYNNFYLSNSCQDIPDYAATVINTLNIAGDFNLTGSDTLKGIEITFKGNDPDLAGVYLSNGVPVQLLEFHGLRDAIHVFPNPSSDQIKISFSGQNLGKVMDYCIINSFCMKIREGQTTNDTVDFDISDFASGLYEIHFKSQFGVVTKKFIKTD